MNSLCCNITSYDTWILPAWVPSLVWHDHVINKQNMNFAWNLPPVYRNTTMTHFIKFAYTMDYNDHLWYSVNFFVQINHLASKNKNGLKKCWDRTRVSLTLCAEYGNFCEYVCGGKDSVHNKSIISQHHVTHFVGQCSRSLVLLHLLANPQLVT